MQVSKRQEAVAKAVNMFLRIHIRNFYPQKMLEFDRSITNDQENQLVYTILKDINY